MGKLLLGIDFVISSSGSGSGSGSLELCALSVIVFLYALLLDSLFAFVSGLPSDSAVREEVASPAAAPFTSFSPAGGGS